MVLQKVKNTPLLSLTSDSQQKTKTKQNKTKTKKRTKQNINKNKTKQKHNKNEKRTKQNINKNKTKQKQNKNKKTNKTKTITKTKHKQKQQRSLLKKKASSCGRGRFGAQFENRRRARGQAQGAGQRIRVMGNRRQNPAVQSLCNKEAAGSTCAGERAGGKLLEGGQGLYQPFPRPRLCCQAITEGDGLHEIHTGTKTQKQNASGILDTGGGGLCDGGATKTMRKICENMRLKKCELFEDDSSRRLAPGIPILASGKF